MYNCVCSFSRYVRCLKPNSKKLPNDYVPVEVLQQLRYSGMLDIIRIKREVGIVRGAENHSLTRQMLVEFRIGE
jgi:hypothetical protein